jgi:hypothetical protein
MNTIVIEVPHQRSPSIWVAKDEQHIIQMASEVHDFCYEEWNIENAVDCFGDEIPDEYNEILKNDKKVIVVGWSGQTECYSLKDADSEIDLAKEAIGHDLSNCYFLTVEEAKEFTLTAHADVQIVLNKFIAENDYLFGVDA